MKTAKAWLAGAGLVVTSLTAILADDVFNLDEGVTLVTVVAEIAVSIFTVYRIPNKPAE